MILVPDENRKFPLQRVQNLDLSIYELLAVLTDYKRANDPSYTDESPADPGMLFLWLYCNMADFMVQHINRTAMNCFLATVTDRRFLQWHCDSRGYSLGQNAPAAVDVLFTCESGHPEFTIRVGTQVATEGTSERTAIIFETDSDVLVTVGTDEVTINCVHGYTVSDEILGISEGEADQLFYLSKPGALWESEIIEVSEGGWQEWTRVDDFIDSEPDSKQYRAVIGNDGKYYILFGDGTNGKIPPGGSLVRSTYRVGGGTIGNVAAGTIVELASPVEYVESVSNAAAASGGTDAETVAHAKKYVPALARSGGYAITVPNIIALAETFVSPQFGRIVKVSVVATGLIVAEVRIVPASGGMPSDGLKQVLREFLFARRVITSDINVLDPAYKTIDIDLDIWVQDNHLVNATVEAVRAALITYISPTYQDPTTGMYPHDFGRDMYTSILDKIVVSAQGVDHCSFTTPSADVTVAAHEIATMGTLSITAYQGNETFSFTNLETDL